MRAKVLLLPVFAVFLLTARYVCAKTAIVGDSFTFTVEDRTCPGETACSLKKATKTSTEAQTVTVATRVSGSWVGHTGYKERIKHVSPTEFRLEVFKMTDEGTYELIGEEQPARVQLTGRVPYHLSAVEGGAATLQSHLDTEGKDLELTGWERDGRPVCKAGTGDRATTTGAPCVPPDWNESGNLSLVLQRVRMDQQGLYLNYVQGGDGRTDVTAVRLTVYGRTPDPVTPVPTPSPNDNTYIWIVVIVVLVVLAAAGWGWALWLRFHRLPAPGPPRPQNNGADAGQGRLLNGIQHEQSRV